MLFKMWRSLVVARAFIASQGVRNLIARHSEVLSSESITRFHHLNTSTAVSRSRFFGNPRFFSQHSSSTSDLESNVDEFEHDLLETVEDGESSDIRIGNSISDEGIHEFDGESVVVEEDGDIIVDNVAPSNEEVEEVEIYEVNVEQLESLLSLLQSTADGSFESSLDGMGLTLHGDFVMKVLETPHIMGENLIRFFRWAMNNHPEFIVTARIVDALVHYICSDLRKKDAYSLWDTVKDIGEKHSGLLDAEILNQLISNFSKLGKGKAALEVFDKFDDFGCVPNADSFFLTIEALCRRSFNDWAWSVCEKMLDVGSLPESDKVGKIVSWFCKGNKAKDAHSAYLLAKEKKLKLPLSSVNFLVSSLCREDETVELALEMLNDFSMEKRRHAIKSHMVVIHGLCRTKNTSKAKTLLSRMIVEGPPPGNAAFNAVINGFSKAGELEEAMEMIKLMKSRGLKPDVYTYTVVISGYAKGGQMKEAYEVLNEAKKKHAKLTPVTYHTLIRNHCKLEEFDRALDLLSEMKDFGVRPNVDEYNKLIQSLCLKALDWKTAEKLFEKMKEEGLHLNGITRGLIRAVKELDEEEVGTIELSLEA